MVSTRQSVIMVALLCRTVKAQLASTTELPGPQHGPHDIDTSTLPTYLVVAPQSSTFDNVNLLTATSPISVTSQTTGTLANVEGDSPDEVTVISTTESSVTSIEAEVLLTAPLATASATAETAEDSATTPASTISAISVALLAQDTTTSLSDLTTSAITAPIEEITQDASQSDVIIDSVVRPSSPSSTPFVQMTRIVTTMLTVSGSSTMHTVLTTDVPVSILAAKLGTSAAERQIGPMSLVILLATSVYLTILTYMV